MTNILLSDVSLCGSSVANLGFKEKLEIAKSISDLGVESVQFNLPSDKADEVLIKTLCACVGNTVIALNCGKSESDIEKGYKLISSAKKKRLVISIPVSPVAMEYQMGKKPKAVFELVSALIKKAVSLIDDVEVVFEDATRAEDKFLIDVIKCAVDGGVKTITLTDIEGSKLSCEFSQFIENIITEVPELKGIRFGVSISNAYLLAVSDYVSAIEKGVNYIKTSFTDENLLSVSSLNKTLDVLGEKKNFTLKFNKVNAIRVENKIKEQLKSEKSSISVDENQENQKIIKKNITLSSLTKSVKKLGYDLTNEDMKKVYEEFSRLSEKKEVSVKELDVIVATSAMQVPATYTLKSFSVNSSNVLAATASVVLIKDGVEKAGISFGNGSVDAAFLAIENITGRHFELDGFELGAVTEGKEAMGQTLVKLRANGKVYSGRGVSTDIVGSSIRAYVNALNKIVFEEKK